MYGFAVLSTVACVVIISYYVRGQTAHELRVVPESVDMSDDATQSENDPTDDTLRDNDEDLSNKIEADTNKVPIRVLLRIMLGTVYGACFLFSYYCLNAGTSVVESLVFLFYEFLGGSYTMCSLTVVLTVLFEIPIFHYGKLVICALATQPLPTDEFVVPIITI